MSSQIQIPKHCLNCGAAFIAKTLKTRYCSHRCNQVHYKILKREERLNAFKEDQLKPKETTAAAFEPAVQLREFLSIEDAAKLIGASKRTIFRLVADNKLKAAKVGRRTIIKRTEIEKLFD